MDWSFKNKLKSLSNKDFFEYFNNRDRFSKKYYSLIEQEARNRFFSNKEFNGENDEYINPQSSYYKMIKNRKRMMLSSIILLVVFALILCISFFFPING